MPATPTDPTGKRERALLRWLLISAVGAAPALLAGRAEAQNYPWCSNFADGAGTNCGWSSEQQCRLTVQGSGGYCSYNNAYRPPVAATPARHRPSQHHGSKT